MNARTRMLQTLKRTGARTIPELQETLGVSETTVRHHLARLRSDGLVAEFASEPSGPGRPALRYALTAHAEGAFPKRDAELLALVLEQAAHTGAIAPLLEGVARRLAERVRPEIAHLPPEARLRALLERLDGGDMLGRLDASERTWAFRAYNCVYRDASMRFAEVCELLPAVVRTATGLPCERVACQRDGNRSCLFAGGFVPE